MPTKSHLILKIRRKWDCGTFLIKISRKPSMLNVTENMLFSLNKSSTHRSPVQNAMRIQVISYFWKNLHERSAGTYLTDTWSIERATV